MPVNLDRILKKGGLTGKEVGQALLQNTVNNYSNNNTDSRLATFTTADLQNMVAKLTEQYDIRQYNKYVHITNFLTENLGFASAFDQQTQGCLNLLTMYLSNIDNSQKARVIKYGMPCIMTKSMYDTLVSYAAAERAGITLTFADIYNAVARHYLALYVNDREQDNPLATAYSNIEKSIYSSRSFIDRYNEKHSDTLGYYMLKNTDISQKNTTPEQWKRHIEQVLADNEEVAQQLYAQDDSNPYDTTINDMVNISIGAKITDEDSIFWKFFEWVEEKITELPGKDNIENILFVYDIFKDDGAYTEKSYTEDYNAFKKEFKTLHNAILSVVYELFPRCKKEPELDYFEPITHIGEVIDLGLLDLYYPKTPPKDFLSMFISDKEMSYRIKNVGIAVLQEDTGGCDLYEVDKTGSFLKEPKELDSMIAINGLDFLSKGNVFDSVESIIKERLIPSLIEMYAYETLLDIITDYSGVDVHIFSYSTLDATESLIDCYNSLCKTLRYRIKLNSIEYDNCDFDNYYKFCMAFPLINYEDLKPTQEDITATKDYIYKNDDAFAVNTSAIFELLKRKLEG